MKLTPNNQRITLKNLKAEINALKKEVIMNNKHISDMEIKLVQAEKEIKKLKESKIHKTTNLISSVLVVVTFPLSQEKH